MKEESKPQEEREQNRMTTSLTQTIPCNPPTTGLGNRYPHSTLRVTHRTLRKFSPEVASLSVPALEYRFQRGSETRTSTF